MCLLYNIMPFQKYEFLLHKYEMNILLVHIFQSCLGCFRMCFYFIQKGTKGDFLEIMLINYYYPDFKYHFLELKHNLQAIMGIRKTLLCSWVLYMWEKTLVAWCPLFLIADVKMWENATMVLRRASLSRLLSWLFLSAFKMDVYYISTVNYHILGQCDRRSGQLLGSKKCC